MDMDDLFKVVGISTDPYPSVWDEDERSVWDEDERSVWDEDERSETSSKRHSKKSEVKLTDYGEFISPKRKASNIVDRESLR